MERHFNTTGPNVVTDSYTIDPLRRLDLEEILHLIDGYKYFILNAPRGSGKTTTLLALSDYLKSTGQYTVIYANLSSVQKVKDNITEGMVAICEELKNGASKVLGKDELEKLWQEVTKTIDIIKPRVLLGRLCERAELPVVLLLDDVDALLGDCLLSLLHQLRSAYDMRPDYYPQSVILCGERDVCFCDIPLSNGTHIRGVNAFNIKAASVRLKDFSQEDIRHLFLQHTEETGQVFEEECFSLIWEKTEGQPWLVNAIGQELTQKMEENRDRSTRITAEMAERVIERIINRRETPLDHFADKIRVPSVRKVVEPIIRRSDRIADFILPDEYLFNAMDIGLVKSERGKPLRIANEIYEEIIRQEFS